MRRLLAVLLGVAVVAGAVLVTRHEQRADTGRVDVVFDTARGMVPGQLVKIAGARAGHVDAVHLTSDNKARMQLRVERRFLPFHGDATCRIVPEGPISENAVECDPGVRTGLPLPRRAGVPTVPVTRTTAPVSVQDLLNVFAAPTEQRLRLLINELGIGTAGRGQDIDDILRRANPALRQARSLLATVDGQRAALGQAIDQTDTVLARLAAGKRDVRRFVAAAADTTRTTAAHRARLAQAVERLPAMLGATRAGLRSLGRATRAGAPLLDGLERSGPQLAALTRSLPAFAQAGVPAVRATAGAAAEGRRVVRPVRTVVRSLKALGATTPQITDLRDFMTASRDKGAIENLLRTAYTLGNLGALYNGVSHVVTLYAGVQVQCIVLGAKAPGCDQRYTGPRTPLNDPGNAGRTRSLLQQLLAQLDPPRRRGTPERAVAPVRRPGGGRAPAASARPAPASSPAAVRPVQDALDAVTGLLTPPSTGGGKDATGLLDFLLK